MPQLLRRHATPLITGLLIVSLVSGVALVRGVGQRLFHEMHEVLILPFALHASRNRRAFAGHLGRAPMTVAPVLSARA